MVRDEGSKEGWRYSISSAILRSRFRVVWIKSYLSSYCSGGLVVSERSRSTAGTRYDGRRHLRQI